MQTRVPAMYKFECSKCQKRSYHPSQRLASCCEGATMIQLVNSCLAIPKEQLPEHKVIAKSPASSFLEIRSNQEWVTACNATTKPKVITGVPEAATCYKCILFGHSGINPIVEGQVTSHTGQLISTFSKPLVLTPCIGTTANEVLNPVPNSITFAKAVLATDPVAMKFASSLRRIPVTMHILPSWSSGDIPTGYPTGSFPPCGVAMPYYVAV